LIRAIAGEGLVTFLFMFVVMAISVNNGRQSTPENLVLGCLGTALVSVALIYSFADVSGAHFNPAVTFATMVTGKTSVRKGLGYIGIQLFATVFATLALMAVFPGVAGQSAAAIPAYLTVDVNNEAHLAQAFFMELILTFILVYVIFATAFDTVDTKATKIHADGTVSGGQNMTIYTTSGNTKAGFAPIAIGFTLGFLTLIGGTVSGGAFNPARVFGPALVSGNAWDNMWLYWIADFAGAALAGHAQAFFAHEAQQHSAAIKTNKAVVKSAPQ
ncbi:aquaporin-like protein, partial [Gorgonomyces haynaldii]